MDEDELAELDVVNQLVGTPLPGDEILDCVVVSGPWEALGSRLRWRVKIQPGGQKKGKAVHEILGSWTRSITERTKRRLPAADDPSYEEEKTLRREGELIKGLRDVEVVGLLSVGKVRIILGGGGAAASDKGKGLRGGKSGTKSARGGKGSKKR